MAKRCPPECRAQCCRYVTIVIDPPHKNKVNRDEARWFLYHEGVHLLYEDKTWYVQIDTPCQNITRDQRCAIYEDRPDVCRDYGTEGCDHHGEPNDGRLFISTIEQWETFLKERECQRKAKKAKKKRKKNEKK